MAQSQFPGPFEGNYPASLITAIASLVPFIIVSTAYSLYRDDVAMQFDQTRICPAVPVCRGPIWIAG